jgi:hypothetical protein
MDWIKFKSFGVMGFAVDAESHGGFITNGFDTVNGMRGKADDIPR